MAPQQHLVMSWVLSNLGYESRRDRIVITLCGIIPDIDGAGIVIDKITGDELYSNYLLWHRTFGHNIFTFLALIAATFFICGRKIRPCLVTAVVLFFHFLTDIVGSAGPDSDIWPLYPFWPISNYELSVPWQWALNDWKNVAITAMCVLIMIIIAAKKRRSLLEIVSVRADHYCIDLIKNILYKK
ncbi:MAG: metal-dependent hydrolase [Phycisphaerales bacterium]|jgi:membrane-bound metal-dependent hydrolase YbcI (DUF457 family)